ncbi:hypothetical protein GCM10009838_36180 [Catenulispora subtropica]|uniref:Uncharacterized protein n=1 Tax=Catenulispora subtropica TaxID=450798 RepID=A0ABP5D2T5_9ACTN
MPAGGAPALAASVERVPTVTAAAASTPTVAALRIIVRMPLFIGIGPPRALTRADPRAPRQGSDPDA